MIIEDVACIAETERAILCVVEGEEDNEVWVPKSLVGDDSEVLSKGDVGDLDVARWFAEKNGW